MGHSINAKAHKEKQVWFQICDSRRIVQSINNESDYQGHQPLRYGGVLLKREAVRNDSEQ